MDSVKQKKLEDAFNDSEWAKQFGEVRWRVTYDNGEVYTGKSKNLDEPDNRPKSI